MGALLMAVGFVLMFGALVVADRRAQLSRRLSVAVAFCVFTGWALVGAALTPGAPAALAGGLAGLVPILAAIAAGVGLLGAVCAFLSNFVSPATPVGKVLHWFALHGPEMQAAILAAERSLGGK